jgi:hypothetical protein
MKAGDRFEVYPTSANWNLHDNTITACLQPLALDGYGSETSLLKDNLISRGAVKGVKQTLQVRGRFTTVGNRLAGFEEPEPAAPTNANPSKKTKTGQAGAAR